MTDKAGTRRLLYRPAAAFRSSGAFGFTMFSTMVLLGFLFIIVVGLMLSTTIIAAALALGDTISSSVRQTALDGVGRTDISLTSPLFAAFGDDYLSADDLARVRVVVGADERIDGVMPSCCST